MLKPLTILITGASAGIGEATARQLSAQGHKLILVARRADRLEALKRELPTDVLIAAADITDRQAVNAMFTDLPRAFADIDVLVNNAGMAVGVAPAQEAALNDWERVIDTNIKGLLYLTHGVVPGMVEKGSGHIVNIGSVAAILPYQGGNVYGATKAFVQQFSRNLRTDLHGTGVRVSNIQPGMTETEFSEVRLGSKTEAHAVYQGMQPLTAEDVARAIVWVVGQPPHVNIDNIDIIPLDQTWGGPAVHRRTSAQAAR
jgi:NADP-dependent 3-hydroxy acid dehydrogenase YdfG